MYSISLGTFEVLILWVWLSAAALSGFPVFVNEMLISMGSCPGKRIMNYIELNWLRVYS